MVTPRERARQIASSHDWWKDHESLRCHREIKPGVVCGQRLRAGMIDVQKFEDMITAAIEAAIEEVAK
jgi:hypothetical protein